MKKILKKKTWIATAILVAALVAALYVPIRSNYKQTLNALVFKCDENGNIIDEMPVEEITVQVDVNRHKFLLNNRKTLGGEIEFSAYFKAKQTGKVERMENVGFVLENRYAKPLADNQAKINVPIEGADQGRALENVNESKDYLICGNIYYEDNEAYSTGIAYQYPDQIPVQREMKYSENFDKMIWTDYHNGYVYLCAAEKVDAAALLAYFPTDTL